MKTIALLPMKGHSERVPGKNFRDLLGRPLFRWILDSLLAMRAIDQIVINTDAREQIMDCGLPAGDRVTIRDRRPEICGDLVSMNRVLADDVANVAADRYLMTHTTNPLLSPATMTRALEEFERRVRQDERDSLFSVTKVQNRFYRADGSPVNHDTANLVRTQDLEVWFEENSCLYIFSRESFASTNARIGRRPVLFVTPRLESLDIDTEDDWCLVEAVASLAGERRETA